MVGVARSRRCERCKRMKTKCDEKWPTCSPCLRAGASCSGPPNLTKFIHNGHHHHTITSSSQSHVERETESRTLLTSQPPRNLEIIRNQDLPGGASFGHFRLATNEPRRTLTTVSERVAARLVGYLGTEAASWDYLACVGYTPHLPVRLSESAALRDCVALMCSTWLNQRRGLAPERVVDRTLYCKALRSLRRALGDRGLQLRCETLAAATILERLELLFDTGTPYNRTPHVSGIETMMLRKGPPKLGDDLDVHLMLENHAALVSRWVVRGGDNFYLSAPWAEVIKQTSSLPEQTASEEKRDCYKIGYYYGFWPSLVHEHRRISSEADVISREAQALGFRHRVADLYEKAQRLGKEIIEAKGRAGRVMERPDPEGPVGSKFHFESLDAMSFVISYLMICTIMNRILYHTLSLLCELDTHLQVEHKDFCRQLWMCIPFIKKLGNMTGPMLLPQLQLSYEAANAVEREYILDTIIDFSNKNRRYTGDRQAMEALVLNSAKAMTGRSAVALAV